MKRNVKRMARRFRSAALVLAASIPLTARAGYVSDWEGGSRLYPDQISPAYSLTDNALTPPSLSEGVLTMCDPEPFFNRQYYQRTTASLTSM